MTDNMAKALNHQLEKEAYASFLYLSMASWLDIEGLPGSAQFMYRQSSEEHEHMMGIFNYLIEMDKQAIVPAIEQPPVTFKHVRDIFKDAYKHEQSVTASINKLVDISIEENDHSTNNFLQWYVEEQREEEALMRTILDKINLIGESKGGHFHLDMFLSGVADDEESNKL